MVQVFFLFGRRNFQGFSENTETVMIGCVNLGKIFLNRLCFAIMNCIWSKHTRILLRNELFLKFPTFFVDEFLIHLYLPLRYWILNSVFKYSYLHTDVIEEDPQKYESLFTTIDLFAIHYEFTFPQFSWTSATLARNLRISKNPILLFKKAFHQLGGHSNLEKLFGSRTNLDRNS